MSSVNLIYGLSFNFFVFFLLNHYLHNLIILITLGRFKFWYLYRVNRELTLIKNYMYYFYYILQVGSLSCFKIHKKVWTIELQTVVFYLAVLLVLILFCVYLSWQFNSNQVELHIIKLICTLTFIILSSFFYVTNFILFFVGLELLAILYFFFFLQQFQHNTITFLKLKNLLSLYLWLSFFTLLCLSFFLYIIIYQLGVINFKQVQYLQSNIHPVIWSLFLITIFWKISIPGFHFFKLELYQYLTISMLLVFSVISLYISCFFINFLMAYFPQLLHVQIFYFLIYILILNCTLVYAGLEFTSVYQFLAISSVNTLTFCLMMAMIIDVIFFNLL